jgi:hypothetical protein
MTSKAALFGVLTRIEMLQWRGWARELRRDAGFAAAAAIVVAFAAGLIFKLGQAAEGWGGAGLAAAFGAMIYDRSLPSAHTPGVQALTQGVLHPWLTDRRVRTQWRFLRAGLLALVIILAISLVVAIARPAHTPAAMASAFAGALSCAVTRYVTDDRFRLGDVRRSLWRGLWGVWRDLRFQRFRHFGRLILTACVLSMASLGVRLAHAPESALAAFDLAVLVLLASIGAPNLALLRFLARQPIRLRSILARYVIRPSLAAWPIAAIAAVLAGMPWPGALLGAGLVALALAVWLGLSVGYGLTRSPRGAAALVATDLGVALLVKFGFQFGLLSLVWLIFRLIALYRSVPDRRWRDTP